MSEKFVLYESLSFQTFLSLRGGGGERERERERQGVHFHFPNHEKQLKAFFTEFSRRMSKFYLLCNQKRVITLKNSLDYVPGQKRKILQDKTNENASMQFPLCLKHFQFA